MFKIFESWALPLTAPPDFPPSQTPPPAPKISLFFSLTCRVVSFDFGVSEGLRTTLRCFPLLTGKTRMQLRSPSDADACSQGSARPHICHEKDCNSRIYSGDTHFPQIHQQSRQDTSATNPRIPPLHQDQLPPKWIPTRHREEQASRKPPGQKGSYKTQCKMSKTIFGATEPDNPQRPKDQFDNVGEADKDSTWFVNILILMNLTTHRTSGKTEPQKERPALRYSLTSELRTQAASHKDQDRFQQH